MGRRDSKIWPVAALCVALSLCAPAAAAAAFTAPVRVSDAGQQTIGQQLSVAASGRAAAIWQTLTEIRLAWGTTGAGFHPGVGVASGALFDVVTAAVGLDAMGRATRSTSTRAGPARSRSAAPWPARS